MAFEGQNQQIKPHQNSASPSTTAVPVSSSPSWDDDSDECAVAKRELRACCPCGNPIWNEGDTSCRVCITSARRWGKSHSDLRSDDEWTQEFRRMLVAESKQKDEKKEGEEEKKGIAEGRGAETERDLRGGECSAREDRMRFAQEACGEQQGLILGLVNPPTSDDKVIDDEVWGRSRVVPREPWVDCSCGNPVEIRADTLCEVCKLLGVQRGFEIARIRRQDVAVDGDKDLHFDAPDAHECYDQERKERRARERVVETSDSNSHDGEQPTVNNRTGKSKQTKCRRKEEQDLSNEKERDLFSIPSNVVGEAAKSMVLRSQELPQDTTTTIQESRACNTTIGLSRGSTESFKMRKGQSSGPEGGSAVPYGRRYSLMMEMGPANSKGDDFHVSKSGFGQSTLTDAKQFSSDIRDTRVNSITNQDVGTGCQSTLNPVKSSPSPGKLNLTERLSRAQAEREMAASGKEIEPPRPRFLLSFQPFKGVAESREVPVYQRFGRERGSDMEEYEKWKGKKEIEEQENRRLKMASLKATSRYGSNFRPARERRQAETAPVFGVKQTSDQSEAKTKDHSAPERSETTMVSIATEAMAETGNLERDPRGRPRSPSTKITRSQAINEIWEQLCATNGFDPKDEKLKNLHQNWLQKTSERRMRRFMWYDWRHWDEAEIALPEAARSPYKYIRRSYYPTPDATPEGRGAWDGRTMHSGTTWQNAVWFSTKSRWDQGRSFSIFVPCRKKYGPTCVQCMNRKFDCDGLQPKCCHCKRPGFDCIASLEKRASSTNRMKVKIERQNATKAAEELESYRPSELHKDSVDEEESGPLRAHFQAQSRLEQLETNSSEEEGRLKNLNGGLLCSEWKHPTADRYSRSRYHRGEYKEDDNERVLLYDEPAQIGFGRPARPNREVKGLCKDHRKQSFIFVQEKEEVLDRDQHSTSPFDEDGAHEKQLMCEELQNAEKYAMAAAEEYESYRLTIWGQGGIDRKEFELLKKVEMAESLLKRLEEERRRCMPGKEVRNKDQLGRKVNYPGSAQSKDVPTYDRDSETKHAVSREAALRLQCKADMRRGIAPSRESEARHRCEEERTRHHRALRLEELAKKESKQRQQEPGCSVNKEHLDDNSGGFRSSSTVDNTSTKMAVRGASEAISTRDQTSIEEDEDDLEARLEGLVLRTKVQVPEAMRRAMEKDEEWRSFT